MTRTLIGCLLLGLALPALAAEPVEFRFAKEIQRADAGKETILAVSLDSDIYASTRDGFVDLRVFDGKGQETPCLLEKATETRTHTERDPCRSKVVSLHEQEDGIELLVQLEKKDDQSQVEPADGLSIVTPLKNYERRVRVLGSSDGTAWTPLVDNALVFDYSRYMDIGNREIKLPQNDCRQYRVIVSGIADAKESALMELTRKYQGDKEAERVERTLLERRPFRIDRIDWWCDRVETRSKREKKVDYAVELSRAEEDAKDKLTTAYVRSRREPLTELTLETSSRNFNRAAEVQSPVTSDGKTEWHGVADGQVSLVALGNYRKESLSLSFSERRQDEYRIVIRNGDNPPLAITGVKARGDAYRVVFLAAANETYRLCYGSDDAKLPTYDAAAVLEPLRQQGHKPIEAPLGQQVVNTAASKPPTFSLRILLNNPVLLSTVVVILVGALGWALFRAASRINNLPKGE